MNQPHIRLLLCFLGLIVVSVPAREAGAAEWDTRIGVSPKVIFTDNVCLSHDDKQSDLISSIIPSINLTGVGARANISVNGGLEFNTLGGGNDECGRGLGNVGSPIPSLGSSGYAEIFRNWFYVDADATVRQNRVNAFAPGGDDALNGSGNLNTTARYSINPYIRHRFSRTADLYLSYRYDQQHNSENIVGNSREDEFLARISSPARTSAFSWSVEGDYSKVDYDERTDLTRSESELSSVSATLGYRINRKIQVNSAVGKEYNDFVSFNEDIDGEFWDAGFVWTPNGRASLDAGVGDRFFGAAPRFKVSYQHKRSLFTAGYSRNLTYNRDIRSVGDIGDTTLSVDEDGNVVSQDSLDGQGQPTTLTQSPILDDRFYFNYSLSGRRTLVNFAGSYSNQQRADNGEDSEFSRISLSASRPLSSKFSVNAMISWDERIADEERGEFVEDSDTWRINAGINRTLGARTNLTINYQYSDRDSESVTNTYTENRITLQLNFTL